MLGNIFDGLFYIVYFIGEVGIMNVLLDVGFQEVFFDLFLKKELDIVLMFFLFMLGQLVKYNIMVYNEGMFSMIFFRVVDYVLVGLNMEDGGQYYVFGNFFQLFNLVFGDLLIMSVIYCIDNVFIGIIIVNVVEIVQVNNVMNYIDVDFIFDFINGNDNNEDDYSIVEIIVNLVLIFDFSLNKRVVGNGFFEFGQDVIFEIIVKNEGIFLVENVVVQDYVFNGFILNDFDWEMDNGLAVLKEEIVEIEFG